MRMRRRIVVGMAWRAYVGFDDDAVIVDQTFDSWTAARIRLAQLIRPFLKDECQDCRFAGTVAFDAQMRLTHGEEFAAEIDGNEYRLELVP
jgi:hypothetical protein